MDVWVFSFFKSIYSPTQYIWSQSPPKTERPKKQPPAASVAPVPASSTHTQSVLSGLFSSTPHPTPSPTAARAQVVATGSKPSLFEQIMQWFSPSPKPTIPARVISANQTPTPPSVTGKRMDYIAPVIPQHVMPVIDTSGTVQTMNKLEGTVQQLQSELATHAMTQDRVVELQKQLTEVLSERSKMEDELAHLRRAMSVSPNPTPLTPVPGKTQPTVSVINTQAEAVKAGLPRLTNVPNVISGIIKDDENNFLPAILVTVTSKDNMPMRALKTNKLGQFAASTPLPNDTYVVEAEDPRSRYTFDRAQITLNGQVVPGIEIIAKSQKQLVREQLSEQIFGKNQS